MTSFHFGHVFGYRLDYSCIAVHLFELGVNVICQQKWGSHLSMWFRIFSVLCMMGIVRLCIVAYLYSFSRKTMPKFSKYKGIYELLIVLHEFAFGACSLYSFCFPFATFLTKKFEVGRKSQPSNKDSPVKYPILFVHGYACNSGYWYPLLRFLSNAGVSQMYTINLAPLYLDIPAFTHQLAETVDKILEETKSEKVILVGHSMGGLVARAFIKWKGGESCVAKLLTLQTPHQGTRIGKSPLARIFYGDCVADMLPGSQFLKELGNVEQSNGNGSIPVVSLYSHHDLIITPQDSSSIQGPNVKTVSFSGIGHLTMPFLSNIQNLILRELKTVV